MALLTDDSVGPNVAGCEKDMVIFMTDILTNPDKGMEIGVCQTDRRAKNAQSAVS